MSDTVQVKVGQVWADNDPRQKNGRQIKVLSIEGDRATVQHPSGLGRKTKVRLNRFRPTNSGYRLVKDVESAPSSPESAAS